MIEILELNLTHTFRSIVELQCLKRQTWKKTPALRKLQSKLSGYIEHNIITVKIFYCMICPTRSSQLAARNFTGSRLTKLIYCHRNLLLTYRCRFIVNVGLLLLFYIVHMIVAILYFLICCITQTESFECYIFRSVYFVFCMQSDIHGVAISK